MIITPDLVPRGVQVVVDGKISDLAIFALDMEIGEVHYYLTRVTADGKKLKYLDDHGFVAHSYLKAHSIEVRTGRWELKGSYEDS